jgi:hypothetical protein
MRAMHVAALGAVVGGEVAGAVIVVVGAPVVATAVVDRAAAVVVGEATVVGAVVEAVPLPAVTESDPHAPNSSNPAANAAGRIRTLTAAS